MRTQKQVPAPPLICVEPNPGPRRSRRLSVEKRWRVVHLSTELRLSSRKIAKRLDIRHNTVLDILDKYHDTGDVIDRPGRGRKRKIPELDRKRIVKKARKDKDSTEIAREYRKETGITVSESTIQRIVKESKLEYLVNQQVEVLSEANKEKRLVYAQTMKHHNWKKVFFSDEKTFLLGTEKKKSWQERGKRKKHYVHRHPAKLHVWAAAGQHMKSELYFFRQNLDSALYQKIIKSRLQRKRLTLAPDCPARLPNSYEFLQDNDPKHKAKKTMKILGELVGNRLICHPAQSPDFNIMEDLWSYLDRKVKAAKIKTIAGLKRKLTQEWAHMPWSFIRKTVGTMPARLRECEELQGGRTHY